MARTADCSQPADGIYKQEHNVPDKRRQTANYQSIPDGEVRSDVEAVRLREFCQRVAMQFHAQRIIEGNIKEVPKE